MEYNLKPGEKVVVVERVGRKIGRGGYMARTLASLAVRREDGSLVYVGHTPYWLWPSSEIYASHYRSGRSRADEKRYQRDIAELRARADKANESREI
jgi:hypothetical protein